MSISIGLIGKDFTITATDTRATTYAAIPQCAKKAGEFSDDAVKTFKTEFGWVSESGGTCLNTTFFKQFLEKSKVTGTNDIYHEWLCSVKAVCDFAEKHVDKAICKRVNSVASTTTSICSLNQSKEGHPEMSLAVLDFGFGIREFTAAGTLYLSNPTHSKKIVKIANKYSKLKKIYYLDKSIIDSTHILQSKNDLHRSIYIIACLIDDICKVTNWISNTIDYGISIQISESETLLLRVHENAKIIKKLYKEKHDLSGIMFVMEVLKC